MSAAQAEAKSDSSTESTKSTPMSEEPARRSDASVSASGQEQGLLRSSGPAVGLRSGSVDADGLGIRPSLTINDPGDKYEREAERVADSVMRMSSSEDSRSVERIQGVSINGGRSTVQGGVEQPVESLKGSGKPLSESTLSFFESSFGHDFSDVRIHTGSGANRAARAVSAEAFTHGQNVVFRKGRYAPDQNRGKKLLAHELAHVVQQDALGEIYIQRQSTAAIQEPRSLAQSIDPKQLSDRELRNEIQLVRRWLRRRSSSGPRAQRLRETLSSLEAEMRRRDTGSSESGTSGSKATEDRRSASSEATSAAGMSSAGAPASVPADSEQDQDTSANATTGRMTSAEVPASVPAQQKSETSTPEGPPQPRSLRQNIDPQLLSDSELHTEIRSIRQWLSDRSASSPRAQRLRNALSSLEAEVRRRDTDQFQDGDSIDRPGFDLSQLSDRELRRAIVLFQKKGRAEANPQLIRTAERLKAEYRRRRRVQFEEDMEKFKRSGPGLLGAVQPARTKPYYKDPSKSMEHPTARALTSGSKEQTFGGLMAGQKAAQTGAIVGLLGATVVGSVVLGFKVAAGSVVIRAGATMAVESTKQAGRYVLNLVLTKPIKSQVIAEFSSGMILEIAAAGSIKEYFQQLQTAGGAAGLLFEIVTVVAPIKTDGPGPGKKVRVKAKVESVDNSGKMKAKVRSVSEEPETGIPEGDAGVETKARSGRKTEAEERTKAKTERGPSKKLEDKPAWNDPNLTAEQAVERYQEADVKDPLPPGRVREKHHQGLRFDPEARRWKKPHKQKQTSSKTVRQRHKEAAVAEMDLPHRLADRGHDVLFSTARFEELYRGGPDVVTYKDGTLYIIDNKDSDIGRKIRSSSALTENFESTIDKVRNHLETIINKNLMGNRKTAEKSLDALEEKRYEKVVTPHGIPRDGRPTGVTKNLKKKGVKFETW